MTQQSHAQNVLVATLVAATVYACAASPPGTGQRPEEQLLATTKVLEETQSGLDRELRQVIRDQQEWLELWEQIGPYTTQETAQPDIDFEQEMLVVAACGTRRSTGYRIEIEEVIERRRSIEVSVKETCPEQGAITGMAMTQPVAVVRLPRSDKKITYRESKTGSCKN